MPFRLTNYKKIVLEQYSNYIFGSIMNGDIYKRIN